MSNMTELINKVAGAKYISRLDMALGYYQIPLEAGSQRLCSFQTEWGVYSYRRMPFGLINASSTLQRLMDHILRGTHRYAGKLLDDILVRSNDFDLHLTQLADVLNRIRSARLTLKPAKCLLATNELNLFGYRIEDGRITPDDEKTKAVTHWPTPTTKKQLKSFVGLTNYFRGNILDYAESVFPLTELLGRYKPEKLKWGEEQQNAFVALKKKPLLSSLFFILPIRTRIIASWQMLASEGCQGFFCRMETMKTTLLG